MQNINQDTNFYLCKDKLYKGQEGVRDFRPSVLKKCIKILSVVFLFSFTFSSVVEARSRKHTIRHVYGTKKKARKVVSRKPQKVTVARKRLQRIRKGKAKHQRISARKLKQRQKINRSSLPITPSPPVAPPVPVPPLPPVAPPVPVSPLPPVAPPVPVPPLPPIEPLVSVSPPPTYLSQLKPYTQRNAKLVGLDQLLNNNFQAQGQTVAVIEESGTYKKLRDAINNTQGILPPEKRKNYKNNFLPAIGGPGLHPEEQNDEIRLIDKNRNHGAMVSSVLLDLAPQAKVLPVSTYNNFDSTKAYDVADAMMDLSKREDVSIINISAGYINFTITSKEELNVNGILQFVYKMEYTPKLVDSFKAAVQAGKVIVLAAGNDEKEILPPPFKRDHEVPRSQFMGHLIEALDPETRQSVIMAGDLNPDAGVLSSYSNTPGNWIEAQERFLCAPGHHMLSYVDTYIVKGTSLAAPLVCAALADLLSISPNITPKMAVRALLDSADERSEKAIYGRGIIRADRALELLERGL